MMKTVISNLCDKFDVRIYQLAHSRALQVRSGETDFVPCKIYEAFI